MRQKSETTKTTSEQVVKNIRRATRKYHSAEEKIRIVLDEAELVAGHHTPVGRPGTPDEVGHVAVFLASEEASYVTGQMIVVDGGNTVQEYKVGN